MREEKRRSNQFNGSYLSIFIVQMNGRSERFLARFVASEKCTTLSLLLHRIVLTISSASVHVRFWWILQLNWTVPSIYYVCMLNHYLSFVIIKIYVYIACLVKLSLHFCSLTSFSPLHCCKREESTRRECSRISENWNSIFGLFSELNLSGKIDNEIFHKKYFRLKNSGKNLKCLDC